MKGITGTGLLDVPGVPVVPGRKVSHTQAGAVLTQFCMSSDVPVPGQTSFLAATQYRTRLFTTCRKPNRIKGSREVTREAVSGVLSGTYKTNVV